MIVSREFTTKLVVFSGQISSNRNSNNYNNQTTSPIWSNKEYIQNANLTGDETKTKHELPEHSVENICKRQIIGPFFNKFSCGFELIECHRQNHSLVINFVFFLLSYVDLFAI